MLTESAKRIERARLLIDQRRWKEAEAELCQALTIDDDKATALYWLAWTQLQMGRVEEAEATAARMIVEDPERAGGYYMRSVVLEEMGKLSLGHYPLSVLLESRNKVAAAEEMARIALRKSPKVPEYRAHLGWILVDSKRHEEALKLVEEGLSEDPESVRLHQVRTESLMMVGRLSDAKESARNAVALDPQNATNMAQLGAVAFRQKNLTEAQEHYTTALRIAPTYLYGREGLLKTLRARTWVYRLFARKKPSRKLTGLQSYGVIFGFALGVRALMAIPGGPEIAVVLMCLLCVFAAFLVLRWYVTAIFNSLSALELRLYPIGRAALSRNEIRYSNYIGLMVASALAAFGAAAAGLHLGFWIGGLLVLLVLPLSKTLASTGVRRRAAAIHNIVLAALGVGFVVCLEIHKFKAMGWFLLIFLFAWLCFEPFAKATAGSAGNV